MASTAHWQNPPPQRVTILYHPGIDHAPALADEMAAHLRRQFPAALEVGSFESQEDRARAAGQDLIIVLGGDGSMLRAGRLAAPTGALVLGVNLGRFGFLPEVQPDEWPEALRRVMAGDYWAEERMLLRAEHHRDGQVLSTLDVLNEVVVGRGTLARPVRLKTFLDGFELTTYVADGLIIATPTGSTAYALAVGGPILPPELKNILLIPIAPHLSPERAIVLAQGSKVEVRPQVEHQAVFSADGHVQEALMDGDRICVRMADAVARFVRVRPPEYFYASLMARMTQHPSIGKAT